MPESYLTDIQLLLLLAALATHTPVSNKWSYMAGLLFLGSSLAITVFKLTRPFF